MSRYFDFRDYAHDKALKDALSTLPYFKGYNMALEETHANMILDIVRRIVSQQAVNDFDIKELKYYLKLTKKR